MGRVPQVSGERLIRALEKVGWVCRSGTSGSHRVMRHPGRPGARIVVAIHSARPIPTGTLLGILKDAELTVEELKELLR